MKKVIDKFDFKGKIKSVKENKNRDNLNMNYKIL